MENKLKKILIEHYQRYPKMQIDDMIKLIFQQTFGPAHFGSSASLEDIKSYVDNEVKTIRIDEKTPLIEDIGNDYFRISLAVVLHKIIDKDELSSMFYQSMVNSPKLSDQTKQQFLKKMDLFMQMSQKRFFDYDPQDVMQGIKDYIKSGIKPMHHSEIYRLSYFPHYRLVHKNFIPHQLLSERVYESE